MLNCYAYRFKICLNCFMIPLHFINIFSDIFDAFIGTDQRRFFKRVFCVVNQILNLLIEAKIYVLILPSEEANI